MAARAKRYVKYIATALKLLLPLGLGALIILGALALSGCASQVLKDCDKPYGYTLPHCGKPKTRRPETPKECTQAGGVQVWKDGYYKGCANRDQIQDMIRGRR